MKPLLNNAELYRNEGLSYRKIAKKFDVSYMTVFNEIKGNRNLKHHDLEDKAVIYVSKEMHEKLKKISIEKNIFLYDVVNQILKGIL